MNAETELARALVANVGEIAVAAHRLHAVLKDESAVLHPATAPMPNAFCVS